MSDKWPKLTDEKMRSSRVKGVRQASLKRPFGPRSTKTEIQRLEAELRADDHVLISEIVGAADATGIKLLSIALTVLPVAYLHPGTAKVTTITNVDELPADTLPHCWIRVAGNPEWLQRLVGILGSKPLPTPKPIGRPSMMPDIRG